MQGDQRQSSIDAPGSLTNNAPGALTKLPRPKGFERGLEAGKILNLVLFHDRQAIEPGATMLWCAPNTKS